MTVVLDVAPTTAHRLGHFLPADPRLGYTVCGIRFAWALPDSNGKAKRCKWCWA